MKKTKEVSKLAGVSRRTLQYYDDVGLLTTERSPDNHRLYDQQEMERIWEILVYKEMDFELKEISDLLELPEEQRQWRLEKKMEEIRKRIIELNMRRTLASMVKIQGMPIPPTESSGKTYVAAIKELKEQIREEMIKEV